jgi:hypothetical protein
VRTPRSEDREYWSLDIPGLSKVEARRLRAAHQDEFPVGVLLTDPSAFMVRAYDRATVELLMKCLQAGLAHGLDAGDDSGARSLLEDCHAWLHQAEPSDA